MKKEIAWKTGTGKEAKVTIELITSKINYCDGDNVTVKCCDMVITAQVEGMGILGMGRPEFANKQGCTGRIGKLGMAQENLDRVNAAISGMGCEMARQDAALKIEIEIDAHQKRMARFMREQG